MWKVTWRRGSAFIGGMAIAMAAAMLPAVPVEAKGARVTVPTVVSGATPLPASGSAGACGSGPEHQNWESEPSLSINPTNAANLATAWTQDYADAIVVGYSTDGGETWAKALPRTTSCTWPPDSERPVEFEQFNSAINPWLSFGDDGTAYLTSVVLSGDFATSAAIVNRSTDGGRTWSDPIVLDQAALPLVIDTSNVSADRDPARAGSAYAQWAKINVGTVGAASNLYVSRTADGGQTWSVPSLVPASQPDRVAALGQFLVLGNGGLLNVFPELPPQPRRLLLGEPLVGPTMLVVSRSRDHGATWSIPTVIAEADRQLGVVSRAAVAPDRQTVYVSWQRAAENGQGVSLLYAKSDDGGTTWDAPAPDADCNAHSLPQGCVGPATPGPPVTSVNNASAAPNLAIAADGAVGVAFYDHRSDRDNNNLPDVTDYWFRYSHDGGIRWEELHLAGPFDQATAPFGRIGSLQGISPTADGFATTFTLARPLGRANFKLANLDPDGNPTDIFFGRVKLK